jgi:hypothetical protein
MATRLNDPLKIADPAEAVAAVPHLLGFHPEHSLVLLTTHSTEGGNSAGLVVRADLPPPQQCYELAEYLLNGPMSWRNADGVVIVVVGFRTSDHPPATPDSGVDPSDVSSAGDTGEPPHRNLVGVLREVLGGAGITVQHALWTPTIRAQGEWQCYDDEHCGGEIADTSSSTLAATMTASGVITFDNREAVEALVAPESDESIARRAARMDAVYEEAEQDRATKDSVTRDVALVFGAIRRTARGSALTEDDLVRVLIALSDTRVRDIAMSAALGELSSAAEELWLTLVRKAPAPELAEVASLLAFSAYLRGDGALASIALERIEATRPEHKLGCLLRQALSVGIPPDDLAVIARDAADDARTLIDEDGAWA